jgi:hypothetical protein
MPDTLPPVWLTTSKELEVSAGRPYCASNALRSAVTVGSWKASTIATVWLVAAAGFTPYAAAS